MSETQIRDYRIIPGRLDEFVSLWKDHVARLRREHGFEIVGAWAVPAESRFVWILSYPGPGSFAEADRRYYASAARTSLDPDPAALILEAIERPAIGVI